jgi:tetratricopeptide (TPR) repeat protein
MKKLIKLSQIFNFFRKSKFSKMSSNERSREQGYAYLLCIEYMAIFNKNQSGQTKISDEDSKIIEIASKKINIGSEYFNSKLRNSKFFDDSSDGIHFKEVLNSFDLKTKKATIKQMLLIYSNREKLENLLDENGNYILKGKYMTPLERISYLMGINEELENIVKEMIYELNKNELNCFNANESAYNYIEIFTFKQRLAILEILLFIGGINKLSEKQNQFLTLLASDFQVNPDTNVSLTELERSNLLLNLNYEQINLINSLINHFIQQGNLLLNEYEKEINNILSKYNVNKFNNTKFSNEVEETKANILDDKYKINEFTERKINAYKYYESGLEKDACNDFDGAILDYTKAIEIDKKFIDAYRNRASVYCSLGNYEGAIEDYSKIIELNPEDIYAYEDRGLSKYSLKNYIGAIEDFNEIIKLDENSKIYSLRGKMKRFLKDYNQALEDYDIAVNKFPNDFSSVFGRGELKYEMEEYQGALIDFNKCIEIKPKLILPFQKTGECRLKIEDYKGAIDDFTFIIENRLEAYKIDGPPSENARKVLSTYYHNRGFARSNLKKYEDAISDLKKAIELNPKFEEAKLLLKSLENNFQI